jgi:formylmethanofuran dehydrogenase subunit E
MKDIMNIKLNNTGKNVVVVFMQLPDDPAHALVIDTDALPDMYNESLRKVVESTEGQQAKNRSEEHTSELQSR